MDIETVNLQTSDGHKWMVKRYLTRRDRRAIDREVQTDGLDYMVKLKRSGITLQDLGQPDSQPKPDGSREPQTNNLEERLSVTWTPQECDRTLERAVLGWDYPDAFCPEAILDKPDHILEELVEQLKGLYIRRTAGEREEFEKKSGSGFNHTGGVPNGNVSSRGDGGPDKDRTAEAV